MSADQALLSLLVVNIDYKLQRRDKFSRGKQAGAVFDPVLRIFGSSDSGQRVCAHIHGVGPSVVLLTRILDISLCGFSNRYFPTFTFDLKICTMHHLSRKPRFASKCCSLSRRVYHVPYSHCLTVAFQSTLWFRRGPGRVAAQLQEQYIQGSCAVKQDKSVPHAQAHPQSGNTATQDHIWHVHGLLLVYQG